MSRLSLRTRVSALALSALVGACNKSSPTAPTPVTTAGAPPSSCAFTVSDAPAQVAASGGEFTIAVTTSAGCAWSASAAAEFISATGPTSGTGSGSVRFAVSPNSGSSRSGSVLVAGRSMTVTQVPAGGQTCEFQVSPTGSSIGPSGGDVPVTVTATSGVGCPWTAMSTSPFVTIRSGSSGSGSGTVVLGVGANSGSQARVGGATVAGRDVTLLQDAPTPAPVPCAFSVSPLQAVAPASGGNIVVLVTNTAGTGCAWIAIAQSEGLSISGTSSGTGSGQVRLAIGSNGTTSPRTLTATVAGQTVQIEQAEATVACAFSITPTSYRAPSGGATIAVTIQNTQGSGCNWTAAPHPVSSAWLTVISGSSGSGSGSVTIDVAANAGPERGGSVSIAGKTLAVQQDPGQTCGFSVSPTTISAPSEQQVYRVFVTNTQGQYCPWTATPSASWLSFLQGGSIVTGYGSGWFDMIVQRNTGSAREATLAIEGRTVTVSQSGQAMPDNAAAVISFVSDPGDSIGGGQSRSATYVGSRQFQVQYDAAQGLRVASAIGVEPQFSVSMQALVAQPLTAVLYEHAQRWPFQMPVQPGLAVSFDHRGCNELTGRFIVGRITFGPTGALQTFHATFEQHCEKQSPALRGSIWIDMGGSTTPPSPPVLPVTSGATTLFAYQSDPDDPIGHGASGSFTLSNAVFNPRGEATEVSVTISPAAGAPFSLRFRAPIGEDLKVGTYTSVDQFSSSGPVLVGSGFGSSCSAVTTVNGQFTIQEFTYGTQGDLYTFRATFELRCGSVTTALRGEIRVMADPWR